MNRFLFSFVFLAFLFSGSALLEIEGEKILSSSFYQTMPRSSWVELDSSKQSFALDDFVKKELVFFHSKFLSVDRQPDVFIKLKNREKHLLVNSFYERVVASSLVDKNYLLKTNQYLFDRVYVYHILFGFKGSSLKGLQNKTKEAAFLLAQQTKKEIEDSLRLVDFDYKEEVFRFFALSSSEDPSSSQNKGEIGWISWGQVMPSFQSVAFASPVLSVSDPVLTDFGYHLIFVKKRGLSDYYYYSRDYAQDLVYKFGLQGAPVDSLRSAAFLYDSLYIKENSFVLNSVFVDLIMSKIHQKTKIENLRGGKNLYIEWFKELKKKEVLFVFKEKGFGLNWFINQMSKSPATRITTIQKKEDFIFLLKSFLIQEGALLGAYNKKLHLNPVFKETFLQHSKNILFKNYEKNILSSVEKIDSVFVSNLYETGVYRGDYIKPRQVVFTEIRVLEKTLADSLLNDFFIFNDFNKLKNLYGGKIKKPISEGGGGFIGEAAFSLLEGGVSGVIENLNKTFSIIRVESFLEAEPFSLDRVYSQIERKIKKGKKDSLKKNLGKILLDKYSIKINREALSF